MNFFWNSVFVGNPESSFDLLLSLSTTEMNLGNGGFDFQKKSLFARDARLVADFSLPEEGID